MFRYTALLVLLTTALAPAATFADDVSGSSKLLCAVRSILECDPDGECFRVQPWQLNVPEFVAIDLEEKMLRTTRASGERRVSRIKNVERDPGVIYLQGAERGRAFSIVITERTGQAAISIAAEDLSVAVFGGCTPAEGFDP